ncbi:caspase family protein [Streptomyces sp. NPDC086549]|uniref:wHTH domain-containing protein n=1 Tax=Streptomyces sp. NPDC086549 TaxID=3365752 RepID=UPI00380DCBF3
MGRYLALLVGASDYQSSQGDFSSLDFIPAELSRLRRALLDRGFARVDLVARGFVTDHGTGINGSLVRGSVNKALAEAKPGDTLLIVLSGHGIQHEGRDYLVPEGLHPYDDHVEESVPVDWAARAVSNSEADTVVFLFDTCREGVRHETKGRPRLVPRKRDLDWKLEQRRRVARVFACSPLEKALWARDAARDAGSDDADTRAFSLFTRALTDLVGERTPQVALHQLLDSLQTRITELHTLCGKSGRPQQVDHQITSGPSPDEIVVLPAAPGAEDAPPRSYADHPWVRIVTEHAAWSLIPEPQPAVVTELKQRCAAIAARLAASNERDEPLLAGDPWHDPLHAQRTSIQLAQLLKGAPSERPRALTDLKPTEAALLALVPFLTHTVEVGLAAAEVSAVREEPPQFATFTERYPRERRRMEQARRANNSSAVTDIRWWLFHRWLLHRGESYHPSVIAPFVPPSADGRESWMDEALGPVPLLRLVNELRLSPFSVLSSSTQSQADASAGDVSLRTKAVVARGHPDQHDVRERLIAVLLKLARARAVAPLSLPQVVVQNLGVRDQIDLPDLRACLQDSYWDRLGKGITLRAATRHHVGALAVESYCDQVDGVLREIGEITDLPWDLRPLESLPARAGADLDAPAHLRGAIRFRADEERVLDLLMGRNLYKDTALAVREMYQNALDACRHRGLRTEYLRRTGLDLPDWEGTITFTQGVDAEGRRYLRCHDNGIGMGKSEIRNAFAEAGARFVHLPEYVREMALWQQHADDLKLHPNSRFGIGVLSYFMLADEITVETCRFGMEGRPGQALRVSIAGPGTLFRIDPLPHDPSREAGTTVTLYLNPPEHDDPPLSCLAVLNEHLWIAPYRTVVSTGGAPAVWEPNELRVQALLELQQERGRVVQRSSRPGPPMAKAADGRLYWVQGQGVFLADGIKTDHNVFGMVVDLRDELRPELLSVDRVELQRYDEEAVERLKHDSISALITSAVFTYDWVVQVAEVDQKLAVACVERAAAAGITWEISGLEVPVAASGVFLPDDLVLHALTGEPPARSQTRSQDEHLLIACLPEYVVRWRLLALLRAGVGGPTTDTVSASSPLTALPTDLKLLIHSDHDGVTGWQRRRESWRGEEPYSRRYLGSYTPPRALADAGIVPLDTLPVWMDQGEDVDLGGILDWVDGTGATAGEVAQRLATLGFRVLPLCVAPDLGQADLPYLRRVGAYTWLSPENTVSWPQLVYSAAHAHSTVADTAEHLVRLGYVVPTPPEGHVDPGEGDRWLLEKVYRGHDGSAPAHEHEALSTGHVLVAAAAMHMSPAAAAERLAELGIEVPGQQLGTAPLDDDDRLILSRDLDGRGPWLSPDDDVPPPHLIAASNITGLSVDDLTGRLRAYGFAPPDIGPPWPDLTHEDLLLLSDGYQRQGNYLHPDKPVARSFLFSTSEDLEIPPTDVRRRLIALGYTVQDDDPVLDELSSKDYDLIARYIPDALYPGSTAEVIPPAHVRAAAQRLGRPAAEIAENLAALGCRIGAPVESFLSPSPGDLLARCLAPAEADRFEPREGSGAEVSLAELASLAVRLGRPFREVALEASRHGFRHDAQDWFEEAEPEMRPLRTPVREDAPSV